MISIIIPTLNADARLGDCLNALVSSALDGIVKEVIVVDGGSRDATLAMADSFGTRILTAPPGRGGQMKAGAEAARGDWLLFLHADTVLEEGWAAEAADFMSKRRYEAAVFTLQFDAKGLAPALVAAGAMLRTKMLKAPYGDQGLLISKGLYEEVGGYADMPLMEDVEFIRRLTKAKGGGVLHVLQAKAVTSAERYERDGYFRRAFKNLTIFARYQCGASPETLAKVYR
ncbi:TIGR04283 family arsenosugar biosynthesis glycosyltransferase [Marinicaulis aureus]|uniref:TIGR04283 family arsenosugar biosynthesis glycosyltransferase n=1 Tax=Hyphococcus aureus TaxID=2666033 RepID=A0ABW1L0Y2_9PROT